MPTRLHKAASSSGASELGETFSAASAINCARITSRSVMVMDSARAVMGVETGENLQKDWRPLPVGAMLHQSRPKLSHGETEALTLYVAGMSTIEVASQMNVKYETAKTYLRRVREKYAKANRPAGKKADLIRRAAEDGYLQ